MSPLGRMVFPRAPPSGKPSSLGETFHHVTPTGMAYLYNGTLSVVVEVRISLKVTLNTTKNLKN